MIMEEFPNIEVISVKEIYRILLNKYMLYGLDGEPIPLYIERMLI